MNKSASVLIFLMLLPIVISACSGVTTIMPSDSNSTSEDVAITATVDICAPPDMTGGVYVNTAYQFFHWEEGLDVVIWHDAISSSSCSSSGSTDDPVHHVDCQAVSSAGQHFDWQIETVNSRTEEFRINNDPYDL